MKENLAAWPGVRALGRECERLHAHGGNRISSVDQMAVGPRGAGHE